MYDFSMDCYFLETIYYRIAIRMNITSNILFIHNTSIDTLIGKNSNE